MNKRIDRTDERGMNNFGSQMIIIQYRKAIDIDVYFPQYNWTTKNRVYDSFKKGTISCPYEKRVYGEGYIGEGDYTAWKNGKHTRVYRTWCHMLERCYDEKYHEKESTYIGCETSKEWLNFQNFGEWDEDNYYEIEGERMHLDKDILFKSNKIYSPDTCIYVPETINKLFTKSDKKRGGNPIGVCYHKRNNNYVAGCSVYDFENKKKKRIHLGSYNTPEEAFEVYKQFKEQYIKQVADYYKDKIPQKLYDTMYNYEVEITD